MPGYVVHLALAEKVKRACPDMTDSDFYMFQIGSIAPDTERTGHKKKSHFWTDETVKSFRRRPDVGLFLDKYKSRMNEPYVLGYYAHLLLDYRFVEEYWGSHYEFFDEDGNCCNDYGGVRYVRLDGGGKLIKREDFFSDKYYYGDYDRMNGYLLAEYKIRVPEYKKGVLDAGGIDEARGEPAEEALRKMLDFLLASKRDEKKPTLLAFDLGGLRKLIADTADSVIGRMA